MFRRKLQALGYPIWNTFDINDEKSFRNLVIWLEDQKIRIYKVEDREELRKINLASWPVEFNKFLQTLEIPSQINVTNIHEVANWLISFAIRLEYNDNLDKYSLATTTKAESVKNSAPKMTTTNSLDKMNFQSLEFIEGVNKIADVLEITKHPNHLTTLEAILILVKSRLSKTALSNLEEMKPKGEPYPVMEMDMGYNSNDPIKNKAAKILRLLYIHDLRDLQTKINEIIVSVQTVTANPKTDTKLGKVGF